MSKRYKVWALHGASEVPRVTHFAVKGADVNNFAAMHRIARLMETALNAAEDYERSKSLTPKGPSPGGKA